MITNRIILSASLLLVAGLILGGCAEPLLGPSEPARPDVRIQGLTPEQLGTLGAKLQQEPQNRSALLEEYNLTQSEFERAIGTISDDPALSRRYRRAYEAQLNR